MKKRPLIIITGPTAVGKTDLSIQLAKRLNGEIISADSIQVYKYMDIGSAKVTKEEMQGVPHYLIDELDPRDEFNIYVFQERARAYMEQIYQAGKIPIIAGGTGFYIQSLLYEVDFTEEENDYEYRNELEALAEEKGAAYLHDMLAKVDAEAAASIHANNVKRVIRALEYHKLTGGRISEHNALQKQKESPYDFRYFVLNMDRAKLYERIDLRVDMMLAAGLVEEVKKLRDMGYERSLVSMAGIGYKEIYAYLEGDISLEEAVYIIKRDTRHFAKRQLTWFRREKTVHWVNQEEFGMDKEKILTYLETESRKIL